MKTDMFEYTHCNICGSDKYKVINTCKIAEDDAKIQQKFIDLVRCRNCGLVFINPQPLFSASQMKEMYSKDYFDRGYMKFYCDEKEATFQSNESFSYRLSLIERYKKGGRLLDIGCAAGGFLKTVQEKGWEVFGVEFSGYATESGIKNHGLNIFNGTLEQAHFHDSHFDVVSAGDILEHVPDPVSFLGEIKRILKPDGIVYVAVPNFRSFHYHTMSFIAKFNNKNYFVLPHHLYHFSPATLSRLLEITGFEIIEKISSESRLHETGARRLIMHCIFQIGRLLHMRDRIIVIARKA